MDLEAYLAVRQRVDAVVRKSDSDSAVPACPDWRVRDLLAHLTGLCEDWVDGRLDGYGSKEWTAAQVDRFSDATIDEILTRWGDAVVAFADLEDHAVMGPPARWAFGDAVTHEADIRGAVQADRVPHDVVLVALKGAVARWRQVLGDAGVPTLLIQATDGREWWAGQRDDPDRVTVETTAYELFRALAGRRSTNQIRQWSWSSDPQVFVAAGLPYPFTWASSDMID